MADNQDPLKQLWLQQEVVLPDISQVSKRWHKVRLKQWCYVALDLFGLVIPFATLWLYSEKLDRFTITLFLSFMPLLVLFVAYITWLRRFSFGWSNASTDEHIRRLLKQIESNIKIANLSLHSVWFVTLLMVIFYAGLYYFEVFPEDRFIRKLTLTLGIHAVVMPCFWIWASRRKKRFSQELTELNLLLHGTNS
tara:strand:+ start:2306 stop:2887 length:582 start_codon:yes stop_codon:yes gene_type:complete